jgi:hypothetical protein
VTELAPRIFSDCSLDDLDLAYKKLREAVKNKHIMAVSLVAIGGQTNEVGETLVFDDQTALFMLEGALAHMGLRLHMLDLHAEQHAQQVLEDMPVNPTEVRH